MHPLPKLLPLAAELLRSPLEAKIVPFLPALQPCQPVGDHGGDLAGTAQSRVQRGDGAPVHPQKAKVRQMQAFDQHFDLFRPRRPEIFREGRQTVRAAVAQKVYQDHRKTVRIQGQ